MLYHAYISDWLGESENEEKYKNESVQPSKMMDPLTKVRHHAERKNVGTPKRNKTKKAIVGIDFGTSFTKVFCSISDYGRFALQFETDAPERFFLPSVLSTVSFG